MSWRSLSSSISSHAARIRSRQGKCVCQVNSLDVGKGEAKTENIGLAVGDVVAAACRTAVTRMEHQTTSAHHAVRGACRPLGICNRIGRIILVPVQAPFPDVPMHVVQTPCVRLFLSDRMRLPIGVLLIPSDLVKIRAGSFLGRDVLPVVQGCCRSGAAGIFPLRFGRQGISIPFRQSAGCLLRAIGRSKDL